MSTLSPQARTIVAAIDLLIALHEDATGDRHNPAQAAHWRERRRALAD